MVAKLSDFGLARIMTNECYKIASSKVLPVKWLAPESLKEGYFSNKTDVWSFGILLGEILSLGHQPYKELKNEDAMQFIGNGRIQTISEKCPPQMFDLIL